MAKAFFKASVLVGIMAIFLMPVSAEKSFHPSYLNGIAKAREGVLLSEKKGVKKRKSTPSNLPIAGRKLTNNASQITGIKNPTIKNGSVNAAIMNVEVLIVGGGGGGGRSYMGSGAGGGGGQVVTQSGLTVSSDVTVTIGAGGSGGTSGTVTNGSVYPPNTISQKRPSSGLNGEQSSFGANIAYGGGGAQLATPDNGWDTFEDQRGGNSYGSSTSTVYIGGSRNYGNNGTWYYTGGGGAGSGGNGSSGISNDGAYGGAGGTGVSNLLRTGSAQFYGGGGGGSAGSGNAGNEKSQGAGGSGGGGAGVGQSNTGNNGSPNTGGGGGGSFNGTAGSGGSGIVVVRYAASSPMASGGTITSYSSGGTTYQVHTFTSSGTFTPTASAPTASVISGTTSICSGSSANLSVAITGGTSPFTVVYSNGTSNTTVNSYTSAANISVSPTTTTTYSIVSVTDANGLTGTGNSGSAVVTVNATNTVGAASSASGSSISNLDILIVGGGGGGGGTYSGSTDGGGSGGGGGQVVTQSGLSVSSAVTITVGTGGAGGTGGSTAGTNSGIYPPNTFNTKTPYSGANGGQSSFGSYIAYGGGGSQLEYVGGNAYGSSISTVFTGGSGSFINGFLAGGGGAGSGGNGNNSMSRGEGGNGGQGVSSTLQTNATLTYGAGGGGSGDFMSGVSDNGGFGGNSQGATTAKNGRANTGGGGGGGGGSFNAGAGGSGIVVVRYAASSPMATGGTITSYDAGGTTYQVHTFTSSGTFTPAVSPTLCINTALTNITHSTTGATGIGTPSNLPTGVTASWSANTITISGTPTVAGTYNYSIPLTGGCGSVNATGTITVNQNTAGAASANPTVCVNTAITNITHTTTGATGIGTATNLPTGVTASWSANTITISGTPTVAGTYNYSIPLTGGCGSVNATGTITVNEVPSFLTQPSSSAQSLCSGAGSLNVEVDPGSGTVASYQWYSNASNSTSGGTLLVTNTTTSSTNSYSPTTTAYYYVTATNSNGCVGTSTVSGLVTITAAPSISGQPSASTQSVCINGTPTNLTVTAAAGSGTISTYKWYSNTSNSTSGGTLISTTVGSLTTNSYTPSTAVAGTTYYYCVITNSNGCSTTSTVSGAVTVSSASVGGTATAASAVLSSGGTTTISLSGYTGSIQWQQSADGSTGWTNVSGGSGANSATYTTAALSATTYYKAVVTSGGCAAASSNIVSVTIPAPSPISNVDVLVVGGGGGGSARHGGGGGGGQVKSLSNQTISSTISITVGSGGTAGVSGTNPSTSIVQPNTLAYGDNSGGHGQNSSFGSLLTAYGGAGGPAGQSSRSGGNAWKSSANPPESPLTNYWTGGSPSWNTSAATNGYTGGGGAGSGGDGGNSSPTGATGSNATAGSGGVGTLSTITSSYYGGGGGGGAAANAANAGNGGSGGGGNGGKGAAGSDGTANTGGGGGGSGFNLGTNYIAGQGGSGVVVVRYPGTVALATGGNISYITSPSNYVLHTFTSSGSFSLGVPVSPVSLTSTGVAATVCTSGSAQTTTLAYTASTGNPTSYSIDWSAAAFTDQNSTSYTFLAGGGTLASIVVPAGLAAGTYTGTMTITNGSSTTTQAISLAVGSASGTITGAGTVTSGTNSTTLTLSGYTGTINWQSSSNNSTFSNVGVTTPTYTATNLTATTFYRAIVTNGSCTAATSSVATITVASPSTAFGISGSTTANTMSNNVATVVDPNLTVTANGTVSGFTVTITGDYTDGDVLGYTGSLPSGVLASSFNTTSRSLNFTGTASAADWQTFLRTVTLTSTSNCYPTNRKVSFLPSSKYFNYFNGHYYEYISTPSTWTAAKSAAASRSFYGRKGYLVTISSEAENNYIWKLISQNSWIGLSCVHTEINSALGYNRFGSTTYGQFYWVTGPEKGTAVSTGLGGSLSAVSGIYNNWTSGEPNNYRSWGENSGHMFSTSGKWNDFRAEGANNGREPIPYIVEYGGSQGDDESATISFTRDIIISGSPAGSITGAATVCNGTNTTTLTFSGTGTIQRWEYSTDNFVTAGTTVSSTASSLTATNLSSSRYYRAVVNTSGCSNLASSSALITVATSTAGSITATSADVCAGGSAALTLNGNSGDIQKWQVSTSSGFTTGVTDISNTTNTLNHTLSSNGTYYFRAAVLNSACVGGTAVYTEGYPVTVTTGTPPVGGTVNSVAFCGGSNSGTLTLSGSTGTSYQWEVSTDGGVVYTNASSTSTTQSYTGISTTTKYRVLVTNGSCGSVYSSVGTITIGGTSGAQWTGGTSTDWGNTANWCGYIIGDDGLDVTISATATYAPTLDRDRAIGNLNFNSSGKSVTLGNFTLTASSITGASSSNYVKTTGTGKLKISIGNGITTSLPVGNTAYNPVSITNNNSSSDYFSVRVLDEVYANSVSGTLSSNGRVKRTWDISKTNTNSGSGLNFVFNWNALETTGLTVPSLFAYSSGNWVKQTGTTSYSSTSLTYTGYTGTLTSFAMLQGIYTWSPAGINNLWSNGNNWSTGSAPAAGAEIVINTGTPQMDADYSVSGTMTLSGTASLTVNAGKTLSVPSGGVANFGGKLVTFKSDATGTGQLGTVAGTLSNATNIVVERHIPAGKRAFRFFSSPVTSSGTIKDNWMEGATPGVLTGYPYRTVSAYNPNLGYGTLITGAGGNSNGFDASQTNNPSLFTFNNTTGAWVTATNTSAIITAGSAYRLFVRGDRSYGITASSEPPPGSTILRTSGTIAQGQLTTGVGLPALSQAASGWSLIGNPYQSVVDMSSADVVKTNLTPYYYVWDPRQSTRGAYVAYNYSLNTSSNNASAVNRYAQPGQAFFVQNTTAGSNSLVFKETAKGAVSNQTATFARNNIKAGTEKGYTIDASAEKADITQTQAANYSSLSAILYYTDSLATGAEAADATRAIFGSQFSNIVDANDGRKFTNLDETMAIKQGTNLLSMELRSLPDSSTIIPLNITQYVDKKYTMRLFWDEKLNTDTLIAYLRDRYTNKVTEIKKTGNTDVEYILDTDARSSAADRFEIIFKSTNNQVTAVINYDNGQYIKIYPNPVQSILNIDFDLGQNRQVDIKVYDMTGRLVMDRPGMRKGSSLTMAGLAKGTYSVKIWGVDGKLLMTEKIIKD